MQKVVGKMPRLRGVMPSRQHLEKDNDLENVREKPWCKAILDRL